LSVRVLVMTEITPGDEEAFEQAFAKVAAGMKGTPGHVRDELLRDTRNPSFYILAGEWTSREEFQAWFDDPKHPQMTTPMRQYWAGRAQHGVYDVAVRVEPLTSADGG
jgi:heme-degrading monooxygenase HmoA